MKRATIAASTTNHPHSTFHNGGGTETSFPRESYGAIGPSVMSESARKRSACDGTCATLCRVLCFACFVGVFVSLIASLTYVFSAREDLVSVANVVPSSKDWKRYVQCVNNATSGPCDMCAIEPTVFAIPPKESVVIASPLGAGATLARELLQESTRIYTGSVDCAMKYQLIQFPGECSGEFLYRHLLAMFVTSPKSLDSHAPLWHPTALLHVTRDPFETILSGFNSRERCVTTILLQSAYCYRLSADRSHFEANNGTSFRDYALAHARQIVMMHDLYTDFKGPKLEVDYRHLMTARRATVIKMLEFFRKTLGEQYVVEPHRGAECGMRYTNDWTRRPKTDYQRLAGIDGLFSQELQRRVCEIVKPVWRREIYGDRCKY